MDWRFLLVLIALAGAEAYRSKGGFDQKGVVCDPVKCPPNCREALGGPNNCPTCLCDPLCSPPKCPPGCEIEKEPRGACPGCDCSANDDDRPAPICDPVKCAGPRCRQVVTPNGCPTCSCGPECLPPACPKRVGCEIKTIPGEPCPVCRCTDPVRPSPQCEAPQCVGVGCYYARDVDECPKCVCDKQCPAPFCPMMVGCEVTIVPGETCPVCKCASQVRPVPGCDPVRCSPGCREVASPNGCPSCECGPLCSPPKCDEPGCEIKQLPGEPCPSCECRKPADRPLPGCDPVKCAPGCQQVLSDRGCPSCECGPLCSPPKCDEPGCEIKQLPGEPCPSCECDRPAPVCDPPKCDKPGCQLIQHPGLPCPSCGCKESECPSVDDCLSKGSMCSIRKNPDGCDSCVCRPICDPPRCRRGCRIKYPQTETECPFCDCGGPVKIGKK